MEALDSETSQIFNSKPRSARRPPAGGISCNYGVIRVIRSKGSKAPRNTRNTRKEFKTNHPVRRDERVVRRFTSSNLCLFLLFSVYSEYSAVYILS